jgi:dipeptidyl aminopeptidase/acylaminoacyl peptidase
MAAHILSLATDAGAGAQAPQAYPIKDFFRNPERGFFRLAEDGKTLGFMQPVGVDGHPARMNIHVQALDGSAPVGEVRRLTGETERDISNFFWKGSDVVLYQKDFGGDENFHVLAVNARSGESRDLTPWEGVRASIEDDLEDDPEHVLISHNQRNAEVFDVYRVNVHTGAAQLVAQNPGNIVAWQTDHAGRVRAALASDGLNSTLLYRDDEAGEFQPLITTDYRTSVSPAFFTFDDRKLYALSNRGRDKLGLVVIDPASPDEEEEIFVPAEVDLGAAAYSRKRRVLTLAAYQTDKPQYRFFDAETEALYGRLAAQLPGYGARYIYDAAADALTMLADINPSIPEAAMSRVQPVSYTSRDGLTIHGYLTLPAGREPRNLACIINPHGGPWARDGWGYNPEVQFLANRGFCVLQMNFRGSTGYGRAFWEAGFGQWGLKMQDDITDGVNWLIAQGIADPARIGIYGGSYGG